MATKQVSRIWSVPQLRARTKQTLNAFVDVDLELLPTEIKRLVSIHEYWMVTRLLDAVDYGIPASATNASRPETHEEIRELAILAHTILSLNSLDFGQWIENENIPISIRTELSQLTWPNSPDDVQRGALKTLQPTYKLLIEVLEILVVKGQVAMALSVFHLMIEYLPLLAWEKTLGHAGDPVQMGDHLNRPGARWKSDDCPLSRADRNAFDAVTSALESDKKWNKYIRDSHSRVSNALSICGGVPNPVNQINGQRICRNPCAVMCGETDLSWAMVLIRRLRGSSIVQLRHDSPVGHFFAVPSEQEILAKWEMTWEGLLADNPEAPASENPLSGVERTGALPGLPQLLNVIAGTPKNESMEAGTLLNDISEHIVALADSLK